MRKQAILDYFGGDVSQTARTLEVTRAAVYQWQEIVPERIAHRVAILTRGLLPFDPSLYPPKSKQGDVGDSEPRAVPG